MKMNRREFLQHTMLTGAIYGSGLAFADVPDGNDRRTGRTIDVHHHILPEIYLASLAAIGITATNGRSFPRWSPQRSIAAMDKNGIRTAIASISAPGIYFGDMAFTRRLARKCNEYSAGLIAKYPGRFGAFGLLPLPEVESSLQEIAYALDTLQLDGFVLLSNIAGEYLGSSHFDDVFAELNRRNATIFIHPTEPAAKRYPEQQIPPSFFEFVFDTTRTVASLIQHNTLQRFPNIRCIVAHGGGTAPYLATKMALTAQISGQSSEQGVAQLQQLYYDTALSTSRYPLILLKELAGDSNIVFGSDFGFAPEYILASSLYELNHCNLFEARELDKIWWSNALNLIPRLASREIGSSRPGVLAED